MDTLNLALENPQEIFIMNHYPKNLIKNKISEIRNRNFGPNPNKALRLADENNPDLTFFILASPILAINVVKLLLKSIIFWKNTQKTTA